MCVCVPQFGAGVHPDAPRLHVLMQSVIAVQVTEVVAEEWVQSIRDSYRPARVADGLWVIPDWRAAPSLCSPAADLRVSNPWGLIPGLKSCLGSTPACARRRSASRSLTALPAHAWRSRA